MSQFNTVMDVFKLLEKSNCLKCNEKTCLAFAVAASANLPAIIMVIFWKRTSAMGVATSILVGMVTAVQGTV